MGVKLRRWVTSHGLSLNIHPDRRYFNNIRPCGLTADSVGSLSDFFPDKDLTVSGVGELWQKQFQSIWNVNLIRTTDANSKDTNASMKYTVYEEILKTAAELPTAP